MQYKEKDIKISNNLKKIKDIINCSKNNEDSEITDKNGLLIDKSW